MNSLTHTHTHTHTFNGSSPRRPPNDTWLSSVLRRSNELNAGVSSLTLSLSISQVRYYNFVISSLRITHRVSMWSYTHEIFDYTSIIKISHHILVHTPADYGQLAGCRIINYRQTVTSQLPRRVTTRPTVVSIIIYNLICYYVRLTYHILKHYNNII